jgi:hypothetical protein
MADLQPNATRRYLKKRDAKAARERFLTALRRGLPVSAAAAAAGFDRVTAWRWRESIPGFRAAWDDAYAEGGDAIEEEARRRAMDGWDEPVFQGGEHVGVIRRYSDRLLERLLKGRKPELYGEQVAVVSQSEPMEIVIRYVHQEAGLAASRVRVVNADENGAASASSAPAPPALPAPKLPDRGPG